MKKYRGMNVGILNLVTPEAVDVRPLPVIEPRSSSDEADVVSLLFDIS